MKQYKQAASAYSEVANRDSKNGDAWYQRVYASQGKDQQAIEELKLGLPSDYDGSVHFQLGRLYQKAGQQKLAQAAFDETKRLQNKH